MKIKRGGDKEAAESGIMQCDEGLLSVESINKRQRRSSPVE